MKKEIEEACEKMLADVQKVLSGTGTAAQKFEKVRAIVNPKEVPVKKAKMKVKFGEEKIGYGDIPR